MHYAINFIVKYMNDEITSFKEEKNYYNLTDRIKILASLFVSHSIKY